MKPNLSSSKQDVARNRHLTKTIPKKDEKYPKISQGIEIGTLKKHQKRSLSETLVKTSGYENKATSELYLCCGNDVQSCESG